MKRTASKNSGETLIETIVAFAIVLLILAAASAAAVGSIRLSGRAIKVSAALETACAIVETDSGDDAGEGTLAVIFTGTDVPETLGDVQPIAVQYKKTGEDTGSLWYFVTKGGDGND